MTVLHTTAFCCKIRILSQNNKPVKILVCDLRVRGVPGQSLVSSTVDAPRGNCKARPFCKTNQTKNTAMSHLVKHSFRSTSVHQRLPTFSCQISVVAGQKRQKVRSATGSLDVCVLGSASQRVPLPGYLLTWSGGSANGCVHEQVELRVSSGGFVSCEGLRNGWASGAAVRVGWGVAGQSAGLRGKQHSAIEAKPSVSLLTTNRK